MKAIELVFDWNLWPRQSIGTLDATNLSQLRESLRAGYEIPPVVINKADYRIIDGFHRTRAIIDVFGKDADIDVIVNDYKDEKEMVLDSGRLNAFQGLKLSPTDRAHFAAKCKKMKIPVSVIAETLKINKDKFKEWYAGRTAISQKTGETIVLKNSMRKPFAGKQMTEGQIELNRSSGVGLVINAQLSIIINHFKAGIVGDEGTIKRLRELIELVTPILDEASYE